MWERTSYHILCLKRYFKWRSAWGINILYYRLTSLYMFKKEIIKPHDYNLLKAKILIYIFVLVAGQHFSSDMWIEYFFKNNKMICVSAQKHVLILIWNLQ